MEELRLGESGGLVVEIGQVGDAVAREEVRGAQRPLPDLDREQVVPKKEVSKRKTVGTHEYDNTWDLHNSTHSKYDRREGTHCSASSYLFCFLSIIAK